MLNYDDFVKSMAEKVGIINRDSANDAGLLKYVCEEVADRLSIYLNLRPNENNVFEFDERLVRIGARIVSGIFTQTKTNITGTSVDTTIKSISDNGQSVSYGDSTRNYLATASDGELFNGCVELLKPYRRAHVVS